MDVVKTRARIQWMDAVRGIAIILVIAFHSVSMTEDTGVGVPAWIMQITDFFLPYRMPALMFLSGLLLTASLRKPAFQYYESKTRVLVWPYILWTLIYILVIGVEYPIYHPLAWSPQGNYLWFIAYITAYYFMAPALKRLPAWIVPLVLILASILTGSGFLYFAFFFFLGHAISANRDVLERTLGSLWMPAIALIAFGFGVYAMFVDVEHKGVYVPLSIAGILAIIWLVRRVENHRVIRPFIFLGQQSLVFYVSHVPIMAFLLEAWASIGVSSPAILIPSNVALAILAGYLLTLLGATRAGRWLFVIPLPAAVIGRRKAVSSGDA